MRTFDTHGQQTTTTIRRIASVAAFGLALTVARPQAAGAEITPPAVPAGVEIDAPNVPFLVGHGVGTQNYVCLPSGSGFAFTLFTPQATLLDDADEQIITHYFGPNPDEVGNPIRVVWQHSRDASTVWGKAVKVSFDENFVQPGAVAWLKIEIVGQEPGATGGDRLTKTTFIQRVNTVGGLAPATGCSTSGDVGRTAFVPYRADYIFYKNPTLTR